MHAARWKYRTQKWRKKSPPGHHRSTLSGWIFATKACIDNQKNNLNSNISSTCPHNMANFGLLAAEICWQVWGTPANFSGFRVLAALLHGTLVVGVSQTLRRWTQGATYIGPHSSCIVFSTVQRRSIWLTRVKSVLTVDCDLRYVRRTTLYNDHSLQVQTFGWQFIFGCRIFYVELLTGRTSLLNHVQLIL